MARRHLYTYDHYTEVSFKLGWKSLQSNLSPDVYLSFMDSFPTKYSLMLFKRDPHNTDPLLPNSPGRIHRNLTSILTDTAADIKSLSWCDTVSGLCLHKHQLEIYKWNKIPYERDQREEKGNVWKAKRYNSFVASLLLRVWIICKRV